MPCVSVNAGRLAASLSIVIGEYFHVPMVSPASTAEFVSEGEHVLDEGVSVDQRVECPIELGS